VKDTLIRVRGFFGRTAFLNESVRGGTGRLLAIAGIGLAMVGLITAVTMIRARAPIESHVAKMPKFDPLPGGSRGDAAQDALLVRHAREAAAKAVETHESYTPPMPASAPLKVVEPGADQGPAGQQAVAVASGEVGPVDAPPPVFVPPEEPARVERVAAVAPAQDPEMKKAVAQLFNQWDAGPPHTEMVGDEAGVPRTNVEGGGAAASHGGGDPPARHAHGELLVPAGRGIYAHTVVAVDSDTNGPVIVEADSGPLAGDRMIGMFTKNGNDRLIVRINEVEHRGQTLNVRGLLIAPDTMETAVATSVDPHLIERWALPAAAAFAQGLGQAVALSNSTIQATPYGGVVQSYGQLNFKQQAEIAGGTAAQRIGQTLTQDMPKGPTVKLAVNAVVGVMFLSDVTLPAPVWK